jgi:hypothetical protein
MSRLQNALNRLETHLRVLIEGSSDKIFRSDSVSKDLAHKLVQTLQGEIKSDPDGKQVAPNLFTLLLPPQQAHALQGNPKLLDEVSQSLEAYARQANLRLLGKPMLKVVSTPGDQDAELSILASFSPLNLGETSQIEVSSSSETPTIPLGAFLIIHGTQIIPLTQAVINIGRGDGNDLVIGDLQVSREHAQLRAVRGRYMIFDLNSTGGTFVNGVQISQLELTPGDLISLAGIPIIYGQEQPYLVEETQDLGDLNPSEGSGLSI